jgi:transposase
MLGVNPASVAVVIKRYIRSGCRVVDLRRRPRAKQFDPALVQELVDPTLLTQWAHFSLERRVHLIDIKYDVEITRRQLAALYKRNGLSKRMAHTAHWRSIFNKPNLMTDQKDFCTQLISLLVSGESVVFVDETS